MYKKVYQIRVVKGEDSETNLLSSIMKEINRHKPRSIKKTGDTIEFKAGMFRFVSNWNLLIPFSSGRITFNKVESSIKYTLSFKELIVFGMVGTVYMTAFPLLNGAPIVFVLISPLLVWGWVVGMNVLIGLSRFNSLIKTCIENASYEVIGEY